MITIDGRNYPLWSQFVENKQKWIGGILEEFGEEGGTTTITDITLDKPFTGFDTVCFTVHGKDFDECFNVEYGGISGDQPDSDWLRFSVSMSAGFRIKAIIIADQKKETRNMSNHICVVFAQSTGKKSIDCYCDGNCKDCEHMKKESKTGLLGKLLNAVNSDEKT